MEVAIQIDHLTKSYGANTVIEDISFSVKRGEIFALLGTNGAGKTTILECIEGLRKYDAGNIKINGKMGVQLQSSSLPKTIKAMEAYHLFCKWNKVPVNLDLFNSFELAQLKNKQYIEMSTGQKRRLHLALALIGNPDILFLDEPTAGLDVEGRVSLHDEIRKLKLQGKTIIMTSHDMAEIESLCDRIAILKQGKIAFLGISNDLTLEMGEQNRICIKTSMPLHIPKLNESIYEGEEQGYSLFTSKSISDALLELLTIAKQQKADVLDIKIERATLEQKFMDIAKEAYI